MCKTPDKVRKGLEAKRRVADHERKHHQKVERKVSLKGQKNPGVGQMTRAERAILRQHTANAVALGDPF
jgi:hypothetical protein